ncbi:hypothetical protein K1719_002915 [Acacia pycnantha]|nr:hypothetical protein K1719_002915 [Acacia pycnantha]
MMSDNLPDVLMMEIIIRLPLMVNVMGFSVSMGSIKEMLGALLSFDDEQSRLILWNPATKEVKVISEFQWQLHLIRFGFDPITMDYKIVRLPYHCFSENEEQPLVEVYNLSTNSWRAINADVPSYPQFCSVLSTLGVILEWGLSLVKP